MALPESGPIERGLRFARADIAAFSRASGDRNPLHIDPDFARRSAFGECVVPGALVAIAMLGVLASEELARIRLIRATFTGVVLPDAALTASARRHPDRPGDWEIRLSGRGRGLVRLIARDTGGPLPAVRADAASGEPRPMRTEPADVAIAALPDEHLLVGEYRADTAELRELARAAGAPTLHSGLLEGLAWASYVVGMELPGRHGLFSAVTLSAEDLDASSRDHAARQVIRVADRDERTGRLELEGALLAQSGARRSRIVIECFALGSTAPPDGAALGIDVPPGPLRGAVAVIGGSRGFGATLALALLARGYAVHVVHSRDVVSAAELRSAAGQFAPRLTFHRADAGNPEALTRVASEIRAASGTLCGLVLNAAPPPIPIGVTADSALELATYVAESVRLVAVPLGAMLGDLDGDTGWVLVSSSPAVVAPPREWPHYAAAKGAIEGIAHWLGVAAPGLRTVVLRPPKMVTDLTKTPGGRLGATPVETVARWVAEQLSDSAPARGVSLLEPDAAELQRGSAAGRCVEPASAAGGRTPRPSA
ncbi:MAG: SDR family NAD(P)-dependent oxidoreductase [Solirubrobacteraceae bacterium]